MAITPTADLTASTQRTDSNDAPRVRPNSSPKTTEPSAADPRASGPSRPKSESLDSDVEDPYDNIACTD